MNWLVPLILVVQLQGVELFNTPRPEDTIFSFAWVSQDGNSFKTLAEIKANGHVVMYGKPDKVARLFWRTVGRTRRSICRGQK